ncbi:ATP-binding protein [Mucilaginibacter sp. SMC90]|uniref:tetratricopeptide repeat-containing sensor histidine kinase n=1 Tax=Mucilaginibacter sp. SMC90 TaxID=2929803 RepID=UPI001FB4CB3A|nr:ATP-binding protein [Mucilaginibacter sp. SMC90]UOE47236.1 ATP-binding protein [Mucilaginibacter sp. SMC90]
MSDLPGGRVIYFLILLFSMPLTGYAQLPAQQLSRVPLASDAEKIRIFRSLSLYYAKDQPDSAVYYLNKGVTIAEKRNDDVALADLLLQLGEVNALHRHTQLARQFYNESLSLFRRLHDAAGVARSYDALGLLDGDNTDFNRAMRYYHDSRDSLGIVVTYTDMGKAADEKGMHDQALSFYLRALTQYEHRGYKPEAYFSLLETIGRLYERRGDTEHALHYFREGVRDSLGQGMQEQAAHLLNAEGEAFEQRKDSRSALAAYKEALTDAGKSHQSDEQAEALLHIAEILKNSDTAGSIADLKQALLIAQALHHPQLEARIYAALAAVYRQQKDYGEAMTALTEQRHLVDSLLNGDTVKEITALDSSYALERAHEKLLYLEQANHQKRLLLWCGLAVVIIILCLLVLLLRYLRKSRSLNKELIASNRVKDTLFSVIGHDLKGPAGSAAQLFELMDTEELPPDEMKLMVKELRKQTAASLELLQALFEWGKSQLQGVKVQPVDFNPEPVVERCIQLLGQQAVLKGIRMENHLPDYLNLHADINHFEFIIRNLLSNAIKFSHGGGLISIGAEVPVASKEVIFKVADQGVGIGPEQQAIFLSGNLKVNFGTQKEKGSGLGLLLTKDFVKANHGRIWLESEVGKGSTFFVAMPVSA